MIEKYVKKYGKINLLTPFEINENFSLVILRDLICIYKDLFDNYNHYETTTGRILEKNREKFNINFEVKKVVLKIDI